MKVAFQGEMGAFSEQMVQNLFPDAEAVPCKAFRGVFSAVESGEADAGVIPVENSLTGRISEPTALLASSGLKAFREGMLRITHCLIAQEGARLESLKRAYAHPEALAQCKRFASSTSLELVSWHDGAAAAGIVKDDPASALIAGERAAAVHGLRVLERGIQDSPDNVTRFLAISKAPAPPSGNDKTSIVFTVKHEPGSLVRALECFAVNGVNLTRLESSPSADKLWEYMFIADLEGHESGEDQAAALRALSRNSSSMKVLGSYPKGELYG
jgi:prephenate dehydratase